MSVDILIEDGWWFASWSTRDLRRYCKRYDIDIGDATEHDEIVMLLSRAVPGDDDA